MIARWHEMGNAPGKVTSLVKGEQVERVYESLKKRRDHRLNDPAVLRPLLALIARGWRRSSTRRSTTARSSSTGC
ncbi:MAG: hypothetical protein HC861_08685 [Rhodospirillaceae bacterium]|nr:hypothetical protein [Rhodospirillaceae bacterium]